MWQAIYPNSYGASQVAPGNTYTIAQGSTQNADSREFLHTILTMKRTADIVVKH